MLQTLVIIRGRKWPVPWLTQEKYVKDPHLSKRFSYQRTKQLKQFKTSPQSQVKLLTTQYLGRDMTSEPHAQTHWLMYLHLQSPTLKPWWNQVTKLFFFPHHSFIWTPDQLLDIFLRFVQTIPHSAPNLYSLQAQWLSETVQSWSASEQVHVVLINELIH